MKQGLISRLLRKDVSWVQMCGFTIVLSIGLSIVLLGMVLYKDFSSLFFDNKGTFDKEYISINKKISIFTNLNKASTYFSKEDINQLQNISSIEDAAPYISAGFDVVGFASVPNNGKEFSTKLFLESVPSKFLDINVDNFKWNENKKELKIIIPRSYITLYNFGFAPSQGLPLISEDLVLKIPFKIRIRGNGEEVLLDAKIYGLSDRINSILVPSDFLNWANNKYADEKQNYQISRVLLVSNNASNEELSKYLNENNLEASSDTAQASKMKTYFRLGMILILSVGVIFIFLALFMIWLSIKLLLQKSKRNLQYLFSIGVHPNTIEGFYQRLLLILSIVGTIISVILVFYIRFSYMKYLNQIYETANTSSTSIILFVLSLFAITSIVNLLLVKRSLNFK